MSETKITDPKKERLESVVEHEVTVRKKSKGQKAVESFLGEEVEEVKNHIVYDMIIPSTKDALSNMFGGVIDFFNDMMHEFIDSVLFGATEQKKTKASQTYVSYQGYYNKKNRTTTRTTQRRETVFSSRHDIEDLDYDTVEDATRVQRELIDRIETYKQVSVAELFDLSGHTLDWAEYQEKDRIGWTDPTLIGRPRRRRGKYVIPLPRPERLED